MGVGVGGGGSAAATETGTETATETWEWEWEWEWTGGSETNQVAHVRKLTRWNPVADAILTRKYAPWEGETETATETWLLKHGSRVGRVCNCF